MRSIMKAFMTTLVGLLSLVLLSAGTAASAAEKSFPLEAKKILFLGDSITHAGNYIAWIETQLRMQGVEPMPEMLNVGLSSETCSGLSEPAHPFPRPDVHERLQRALEQLKPDVVVACYGMNDGIYHPFNETRFAAYQAGVNKLIERVHASGAKLVLMTPPPFDAVPLKSSGKLKPAGSGEYAYFAMYENYDDVLRQYAAWIMEQRGRVEMVIDLHTPFDAYLTAQRKTDPSFSMTPDGIHPNLQGQRLLGEIILKAWGVPTQVEPNPELLKLVTQRMTLLHDAWLSQIGHKRPGVKAGLPVAEAEAKAAELRQAILMLTSVKQP